MARIFGDPSRTGNSCQNQDMRSRLRAAPPTHESAGDPSFCPLAWILLVPLPEGVGGLDWHERLRCSDARAGGRWLGAAALGPAPWQRRSEREQLLIGARVHLSGVEQGVVAGGLAPCPFFDAIRMPASLSWVEPATQEENSRWAHERTKPTPLVLFVFCNGPRACLAYEQRGLRDRSAFARRPSRYGGVGPQSRPIP